MNFKLQFNDHEQQGGSIALDAPALCLRPVSPCPVPAVLSTQQTPAVPPRSQKTPVFSGAGYRPRAAPVTSGAAPEGRPAAEGPPPPPGRTAAPGRGAAGRETPAAPPPPRPASPAPAGGRTRGAPPPGWRG